MADAMLMGQVIHWQWKQDRVTCRVMVLVCGVRWAKKKKVSCYGGLCAFL